MFILASCLQVSSVSNFHPDTRGRRWSFIQVHLFNCAAEGGTLQTYITGVCGECSQCLGHTGFAHGVCFPVYTAQAPGCSTGELSKAGPGLRALPRSKPLRFRFSGTPQRHRLGLCFVPFPGLSSSGVQVLCERTTSGVPYVLSPPQSQSLGFLGAPQERHLKFALCPLGS